MYPFTGRQVNSSNLLSKYWNEQFYIVLLLIFNLLYSLSLSLCYGINLSFSFVFAPARTARNDKIMTKSSTSSRAARERRLSQHWPNLGTKRKMTDPKMSVILFQIRCGRFCPFPPSSPPQPNSLNTTRYTFWWDTHRETIHHYIFVTTEAAAAAKLCQWHCRWGAIKIQWKRLDMREGA